MVMPRILCVVAVQYIVSTYPLPDANKKRAVKNEKG